MVLDLLQELLWVFSLVSILVYSIQSLRNKKKKNMSVAAVSHDSSSSSSFSPSPGSPFSCAGNNGRLLRGDWRGEMVEGGHESKRRKAELESSGDENMLWDEKLLQCHEEATRKGLHDRYAPHVGSNTFRNEDQLASGGNGKADCAKTSKLRKRPARLILPECSPLLDFRLTDKKIEKRESEVEGRDYFLASKKGRRDIMEDGYGIILDILGDPKKAFFAVIDGHGGRAAAGYVAENLGKNIVNAIESIGKEELDGLEQAIRGGYTTTDEGFLSKGVMGGACTASVLVKDGQLHVANVGDCRVVLSRNGVAEALTKDHRPSREDERLRIENSGGFVHFRNGVWRVQGSLAISRAIGDAHLKEWIISEPEIKSCRITAESEFLILASDGLWDKVSDQEAVDVVSCDKNLRNCCKKLVDMSSSRGNLDDITVMVINLQNFVADADTDQ